MRSDRPRTMVWPLKAPSAEFSVMGVVSRMRVPERVVPLLSKSSAPPLLTG